MRLERFASSPLASLGVAACIAVALASAVVEVPRSVAKLSRRTEHSASLSFSDRAFALGNSIYPDQALLYEARASIPPDGRYRVDVAKEQFEGEKIWTHPSSFSMS